MHVIIFYTPVNGLRISCGVCCPSNIVFGILLSELSQQAQLEVPLTCIPKVPEGIVELRDYS